MEEAGVNLGMIGKRHERREGERDGSGSVLGSGLLDQSYSKYEQQPQKFIWTDAFPYRMLNSVDDAAGFRLIPPVYPSSGTNIINGDGLTTFFYNPNGRGICDASFVKDSIKSQVAIGMSGGGLVGMNQLRYPLFTQPQLQELKRQALIYKHFVSSSPIPPDLIFDPSRALPTIPPLYPTLGGGGYFNLRRFTNKTDLEPGRCRRTDGKKWRCSRDVAPDQKYCERHLHRNRPRSRKPVEQRQKTTTTVPAANVPLRSKSTATEVSKTPESTKIKDSSDPSAAVSHFNIATTTPSGRGQDSPVSIRFPFLSMPPEKEPRYSNWMSGDGILEDMHSNNYIGMRTTSTPSLLHYYEENLNLNYYNQSDPCYTFLNPTISSMDEYQTQDRLRYSPRSFIDAWSNEKPTTVKMSSSPPYHLTLSMSNNDNDNSSTDQIQMGLGITDFHLGKAHSLSWMNNDAAGGPLAEVLQSGTATSSPRNSNDDGDGAISGKTHTGLINLKGRCPNEVNSPPQLVISSPTGVLHRTLVSLSDCSTKSSTTFAAESRRSEIGGFPWISLAK